MKKLLLSLVATTLLFTQAYGTTLVVKNKTPENLHFWAENHPFVNSFINRRIIKPGRNKTTSIILTAQGLRGPFYFARTRDLPIKRQADGKKYRLIYRLPKGSYMNNMELLTWVYKWVVANKEDSQPQKGLRIKRTWPLGAKLGKVWASLEPVKVYVK